jgi:toxin CptA
MKSATAIAFDHRPSRWVIVAVGAMLALALAAVALSGIASWLKLSAAIVAIAYGAFELRRFVASPLCRLAWHEAGHWRIVLRGGTEHTAELRHALVRGAWIVLVLQCGAARLPVVLGPDNCDADTRRRLRVRLARTQAAVQAAA